jgi:hypothetical protein
MSLLVRVMQAWERCAGSHMPQALIHSVSTPVGPECTVFSSIISSITHACITHACIPPSPVQSLIPSGRPHLAPSPLSPQHSALVGLTALLASVTREQRMVFSAPRPPSHIQSAVSVAAPCLGAPLGVTASPHIRPRGPRFSFVN